MDPVLVYMDENMLIHARANSWKMFSFQANNNLWYTYSKDFSVISYQSKPYHSLRFPKLLWKNLKISCLFHWAFQESLQLVMSVVVAFFFLFFFKMCLGKNVLVCMAQTHSTNVLWFCLFVHDFLEEQVVQNQQCDF